MDGLLTAATASGALQGMFQQSNRRARLCQGTDQGQHCTVTPASYPPQTCPAVSSSANSSAAAAAAGVWPSCRTPAGMLPGHPSQTHQASCPSTCETTAAAGSKVATHCGLCRSSWKYRFRSCCQATRIAANILHMGPNPAHGLKISDPRHMHDMTWAGNQTSVHIQPLLMLSPGA